MPPNSILFLNGSFKKTYNIKLTIVTILRIQFGHVKYIYIVEQRISADLKLFLKLFFFFFFFKKEAEEEPQEETGRTGIGVGRRRGAVR